MMNRTARRTRNWGEHRPDLRSLNDADPLATDVVVAVLAAHHFDLVGIETSTVRSLLSSLIASTLRVPLSGEARSLERRNGRPLSYSDPSVAG